ncbi:MAG: serine/threonine-protein kinase [Rivularia sp. (in: cyanobacteria)]
MLETNQVFQQRYQLKEKLAQNAGRQTWLAEYISIQPAETVILKFLSFGENFQWQDLKLFEREADILKQLSHPKIPKYRDYFSVEDKNNWFALVQEYIPGESLKQLIEKKQRFTEEELHKIASEVLEILCYLHTLNPQVIHRDIKPSNLILGVDKKVYLIDFGAVQDNAAAKGATFTVVGTYGYAPLEQFGGRTVPASDLYALGATLIHLATGKIPADLPQTKMRIKFQDQVSLSDGFIRWIEKLTEPDIDDRFSSAEEALYVLNNSLDVDNSDEIAKPISTRIKLNKSNGNLEIKIPAARIKFTDFMFLFFPFIIFLPFSFKVACIISSIIASLIIIFRYYANLYLIFNREYFLIKWKVFKFTYFMKQGSISELIYFGIEEYENKNERMKTILIKTETEKYAVKVPLADTERNWLAKEIKHWLDV